MEYTHIEVENTRIEVENTHIKVENTHIEVENTHIEAYLRAQPLKHTNKTQMHIDRIYIHADLQNLGLNTSICRRPRFHWRLPPMRLRHTYASTAPHPHHTNT